MDFFHPCAFQSRTQHIAKTSKKMGVHGGFPLEKSRGTIALANVWTWHDEEGNYF
jgi:hypothetical protein